MKYDFKVRKEIQSKSSKNDVILACGKGKKEDEVIVLDTVEFSYLEGLIWDKYREYSPKVKNRIMKSDLDRIISGCKEASLLIEEDLSIDVLKEVLQCNIYRLKVPLENIRASLLAFKEYLLTITSWLEEHTKDEKMITILRDKSQIER